VNGWDSIWHTIISPIVQIVIIYILVYWVIIALERIAAAVKLRGLALAILVIVLAALGARFAQMHALSWLLENAISFSLIVIAIVFQPEVRRLFTRMGGLLSPHASTGSSRAVSHIIEAVQYMSARRIGALIVIERNDNLDDFAAASPLDCRVNSKLICSLFWRDSPLHDGAIIIKKGRVVAAGVILPLTENYEYKHLSGTRHRAGIGISEDTDALAVLVSEETGIISVADHGAFTQGITIEELELVLGRVFGHRPKTGDDA
jgi:diadenylate cyclase